MNKVNVIFLRSDIANGNALLDRAQMDFLFELKKNGIDVNPIGTPLFYIETGGSEEKFRILHHAYKEPFYIISTSANNSLPASLEIMSYLRENNKKAHLIHGEIDEIIKGIKDIKERKEASVFKTGFKDKILDGDRLGVIGKPSDWLIASNTDYSLVKEKLGAELIDIPYDEFLDDIKNAKVDLTLYKEFIDSYKNEIINEGEIIKALEIYLALKELVKKYKLNGLTVRCFDLLGTVKSTSCLGFAFLNQEGITATCEGDIPSLLSMRIVKKAFDLDTFQANPSYINEVNNYMIIAHCTVPFSMCYASKLDTHFESGIGIGIKGELSEENITIFKLSNKLDEFMVMDAKIGENLAKKNLCRTQIKVRSDDDLSPILAHPLGNHLIIFYGHHKKDLVKLLG